MRTYDPNYPTYREYPKWVCGVLANDAAEEVAIKAAVAAASAEERAERGAGLLLVERELKNGAEPGTNRGTTPSRDTTRLRDATASAQQTRAEIAISHDQSAAALCPKPTTADIIAAMQAIPGAGEPARPISPAGIRMARMRARRRDGKRAVMLDVSATQVEALVLTAFLDPAMQHDAAEVALGVGRLLDQHATRYGVSPVQVPAGCS